MPITAKMLEEILYKAFSDRIEEIKNGPDEVIEFIKGHCKELFDKNDDKIVSLLEADEVSFEIFLNLSVAYFIQALIFELAPESFFD